MCIRDRYITISKKITKNEKNLLLKYTKNQLVYGGKTRFASLKQALKNINSNNYEFLMIHDAARPAFTKNIIIELLSSMNSKKYHGQAKDLIQNILKEL